MSVLGFFHTGVGLAALFLGTMVIFQPKGTPRHRLLGRLFAMAMLLLNVTAADRKFKLRFPWVR